MKLEAWPTNGLRRLSINSFGFGGTNAHVILDDASNYLSCRGLGPPFRLPINSTRPEASSFKILDHSDPMKRIFVLSAYSRVSLEKAIHNLESYLLKLFETDYDSFLENLAYTLFSRRTYFAWRIACSASTISELIQSLKKRDPAVQNRTKTSGSRTAFVFNGQGTAWYAMGRELIEV